MFNEQVYQSMNEQITPSCELLERVRAYGDDMPGKRNQRFYGRAVRRVALVAVLLLCLCFAVPALAVNSPSIYRLMRAVSPAIAQFFVPVQESCEYDGIRMEVVSSYVHDDTAEIYVTMQDLSADRMDASIDLYDSYDLTIPFDSIGTCKQLGYDAETKTATFLIRIATMDGSPIPSVKATFAISCFLSGKQELLDAPLTIDLSGAEGNPETLALNEPQGGNTWKDPASGAEIITPVYERVLKPQQTIAVLHEGFNVSGIGYIEGRLHIQLHTPGRMAFDDHAFLELTDAQGNAVRGDMVYHDFVDEATGHYVDYIDYVFDVPQTSLQGYTLSGSFYTAESRTDGRWQVTVPLKTSEG